ncbi:hypothetical protein [Burkholderia sp. 3C]
MVAPAWRSRAFDQVLPWVGAGRGGWRARQAGTGQRCARGPVAAARRARRGRRRGVARQARHGGIEALKQAWSGSQAGIGFDHATARFGARLPAPAGQILQRPADDLARRRRVRRGAVVAMPAMSVFRLVIVIGLSGWRVGAGTADVHAIDPD